VAGERSAGQGGEGRRASSAAGSRTSSHEDGGRPVQTLIAPASSPRRRWRSRQLPGAESRVPAARSPSTGHAATRAWSFEYVEGWLTAARQGHRQPRGKPGVTRPHGGPRDGPHVPSRRSPSASASSADDGRALGDPRHRARQAPAAGGGDDILARRPKDRPRRERYRKAVKIAMRWIKITPISTSARSARTRAPTRSIAREADAF